SSKAVGLRWSSTKRPTGRWSAWAARSSSCSSSAPRSSSRRSIGTSPTSSELPPVVIQLQRVSKRYRAGRSRTLTELIGSRVRRLIRPQEEDSVYSLTLGKRDANIWAVEDLDFEVQRGAGIGVIGPNGAGKTTLLKLISRVTWPTSGRVRVAGRVVSL